MFESLYKILIQPKSAKIICAFYLLAGILGAIYIREPQFDYEFERFFPNENSELNRYNSFRKLFENDNDFLLIAIEDSNGIFNLKYLQTIKNITDSLKIHPYITSVYSISNIKYTSINDGGTMQFPVFHINEPEKWEEDKQKIKERPWITENFVAKDFKSSVVLIKHIDNPSKIKSDKIKSYIDLVLKDIPENQYHIGGKVYAQKVYLDKMEGELKVFMTLGMLLLMLFLWFSFRSIWNVILPLFIILLSMIFTFAFIKLTGKKIDILMTLMPTILYVVGISDIIHLLSRYIEELRKGLSKNKALMVTLKEVSLATFLTSFTTSVGFASLITITIVPVKEFGIYIAASVMITFVTSYTLYPAVMSLMSVPRMIENEENKWKWRQFLFKILKYIFRNPIKIQLGIFLIALLAIFGIKQLKINNYLLDELSKDEKHRIDFVFFEEKYSGVRPFEMLIELKQTDKSFTHTDVLKELESLHQIVEKLFEAGSLISPLEIHKQINTAIHQTDIQYYGISTDSVDIQKINHLIEEAKRRKQVRIFNHDNTVARLSGRMKDIGSYELSQKIDKFNGEIVPNFIYIQPQITGSAFLVDKNNQQLANDITKGLLLAFVIIAITFALLYRSLKMVIIALLPNIFPVMAIAGLMGWLGIDLKMTSAIIFTISFGIAVDDTIHFLSKLKLELLKGRTLMFAIYRTYLSTGKALVLTSVILFSGFSGLFFSDFQSTYNIGLLTSFTLLIALLFDLTLLPLLVYFFYGNKKNTLQKIKK
jgi:predicted RND superfamily exporter protein